MEGSFDIFDVLKDGGSKKRVRSDSCSQTSSKACREKLRRDKLIDKFAELGSILEPGTPPKTNKAAILVDAVRMAEKNKPRVEKQRLKAEKENLEHQLKDMNAQSAYLPQPSSIPTAFTSQAANGKLVPSVGYPGVSMWQFMPPAAVDTSQDHVLRPPVA